MSSDSNERARLLFEWVLRYPKLIVFVSVFLIAAALYFIPQLQKDVRTNAFLSDDNPALVYRDKVKDLFGLSDPMIIVVTRSGDGGVYDLGALKVVQELTDAVSQLSNVDENKVFSLATEKNITGTDEGLDIVPFLEPFPTKESDLRKLKLDIEGFPIYNGSLVSKDSLVTVIVAEMVDEFGAETTYQEIDEITKSIDLPSDVDVYVAGEGAIAGFLSKYIDDDAQRLNPIATIIILVMIYCAFFRLWPPISAIGVIASSVLISLGVMSLVGVPFYMITSAMPVILIGISVADSIHIYHAYYERCCDKPNADVNTVVVETMQAMWKPITYTSLTTIAGFMGLYLAAYMPPFKFFGLFVALGVAIAWLYSMTFLPAVIVLTKPSPSRRFQESYSHTGEKTSRILKLMEWLVSKHSIAVIAVAAAIVVYGLYNSTNIGIDEDPITIFDENESIYIADSLINEHLQGTNALDVVIETKNVEDLFDPQYLRKIEALQEYASTLPFVGGSNSIVDYLKQINKGLNEGRPSEYRLPDDKDLIAQYFLIYGASSDPTDFEEEIDYDYQIANVRININTGSYDNFKGTVESLNDYIATHFPDDDISASLSGRVNLNYHWIKDLGESHFLGLIWALILVYVVSSILFRSMVYGFLALLPVVASVLMVYSVMVIMGMSIGVGTSMFAAVAIGLGVDFAIHTLDKMNTLLSDRRNDFQSMLKDFYAGTGRALMFNYMAIAFGFGVLMSSKVPSLNTFGGIVVTAVSASFIFSLVVLPAIFFKLYPLLKRSVSSSGSSSALLVIVVGGLTLASPEVSYASDLTASDVVEKVNGVDDGRFVTRKISMNLVDRKGKTRVRETINYRKYYGDDLKTVLFYLSPANIRNTAFLIWDYDQSDKADDQWLYLPALRKVRRISSSDRGDYFLGTDFTYEDIKLDGKLEPRDYNFILHEEEVLNGLSTIKLEAVPKSIEVAKELGYGRTLIWVDTANWVMMKTEFYDNKGDLLKTLIVDDVRPVGNVITRHKLNLVNHKTGHKTLFVFSDVDYTTEVKDSWFSQRALSRGH